MDTKKSKIKNDLRTRYNKLVKDCCRKIQDSLQKLNKTFTDDEDEPLNFFDFKSTADDSIIKICPDGNAEYSSGEKESISDMIKMGKIPFDNAISLTEELIMLSESS